MPKLPQSFFFENELDPVLELFFKQSPQGFLIIENATLNYRTNEAFCQMFGLDDSGLKEEILRMQNPGKWDTSFPFSIKHLFALPLDRSTHVQILRSSSPLTSAHICRSEIYPPGGSVFTVLSILKIAEEVDSQVSEGRLSNSPSDLEPYSRQIIDVNPNLIYVKNREGIVWLANQATADFFGCTVDQFLERNVELFKTFKWKYEEIQQVDDQAFKDMKTHTSEEAFFSDSTKRMHLFQVTRTPFLIENDEPQLLCIAVDITDRVNAENELITQREYLRHILDTDPNLIFVKDASSRFVLVNRAFAEFYNATIEELIGKLEFDLPWNQTDQERFVKSDRDVMASNQSTTEEVRTINPITGKEAHFITTKKPLLDADGNMNILGVVTDITEQKRQEKNVRKSELMLQEIFNRVADALFIIDGQTFQIVDCNPKAILLFSAREKSELLKVPISNLRAKEDRGQKFWGDFLHNLTEVNPSREIELISPDGTELWASLAAAQFVLEGRSLILLRIVDITAQKRSEEQIMLALHEKEILIQEIHHRVKNNMAVISSLLQLQTGYIKDPELINVFRDSQSRIKSMALIHEKLYQSKTLAKVEMESYIRELARTLLYTYNSRKTDISVNISADEVYLDINSAVPCGLIINEIISNACKHAFVGREKGSIDISFTNHSGQFQLLVKDDGIGMPEGTDFSRFNSLGMSLVNALSSQLGARLEIQTQKGISYKITFAEKTKPTK